MTQPDKLARKGNIAKQLLAKPPSGRLNTTPGDTIQTETIPVHTPRYQ